MRWGGGLAGKRTPWQKGLFFFKMNTTSRISTVMEMCLFVVLVVIIIIMIAVFVVSLQGEKIVGEKAM